MLHGALVGVEESGAIQCLSSCISKCSMCILGIQSLHKVHYAILLISNDLICHFVNQGLSVSYIIRAILCFNYVLSIIL